MNIAFSRALIILTFLSIILTNELSAVTQMTQSEYELRKAMNNLWTEHSMWTRDYIIAALNESPSQKVSADRLMKNQEDIGKAIASYYGSSAGNRLTELLKEHISIAAKIIEAAKQNNKSDLDNLNVQWKANARDIAQFLSNANPQYWKLADLQNMLYMHLDLTTQEVVNRLKKDWKTDVANFDKVIDQVRDMGDTLATGIVSQFPNKFGKQMAAKARMKKMAH
jgi:hypothetical protein